MESMKHVEAFSAMNNSVRSIYFPPTTRFIL